MFQYICNKDKISLSYLKKPFVVRTKTFRRTKYTEAFLLRDILSFSAKRLKVLRTL